MGELVAKDRQAKYEEQLGKKLDRSPYVMQAVNLIYEGKPDVEIRRILREKFNFDVSLPSIMYFKRNYYPRRLEEAKEWAAEFKRNQTSQIQTFIDESLDQGEKIKRNISEMEKDLQRVRVKMDFSQQYEPFVRNAFQSVVARYSKGDATPFGQTDEEKKLESLKTSLGEAWQVFASYISAYASESVHMVKLVVLLEDKNRMQRETLIKIYQEVYKSCKALSMLQELTLISDRYNQIISEEFFPNRENLDVPKYRRVRGKLLALYDEFKTRYQGIDIKDEPIKVQAITENVEPALEDKGGGDLSAVPKPG